MEMNLTKWRYAVPFTAFALAFACSDGKTPTDPLGGTGGPLFGTSGTPNKQDWKQCQNNNDRDGECTWTTGNLNQTHNIYFEGDFVPKALRVPGVQNASPFEIVMTYGFLKGGKTTHDFLGQWNEDIVNANPCVDGSFSGTAKNPTGFCTAVSDGDLVAISAISNSMATLSQAAVDAACGAGSQYSTDMAEAIAFEGAATLVIEGINVASIVVTNIVFDGCPVSGDAEAILTMTVTPNAAGVTSGNLLLLFGAHVARSADWDNGGAGDVQGSPYHLGLVTVDGKSAGSMDLQMAAAAIQAPDPATLIVAKVCVGGTGANFGYSGTGPSGALAFDRDCGESADVVTATTDFGNYVFDETTIPAGWAFDDLECVGGGANTSVSGSEATVGLDAGETVTCTYTNVKAATIIVEKECVGGSGANFGYTGTGPNGALAPFDRDCGESAALVSNTTDFGNYVFDETTIPAGWAFDDLECVGGGANTSVSGSEATVGLDAGETVTCTYTNVKQANLIVEKECVGGTGATFAYTGTGPSGALGFDRDCDESAAVVSNTTDFGTYTFDETTIPAGWAFDDLECVGGGGNTSVSGSEATVGLDAGETVTCTYTNVKLATIIVEKECGGAAGGPFGYTGTVPGGGALGAFNRDCGQSAAVVSNTADFGQYTIDETSIPGGWDFESLVCLGGGGNTSVAGSVATIGLDAGETVTCTYTNVEVAVEACSPGYWRQSQHFGSWPVALNTLFSVYFDDLPSYPAGEDATTFTLLDAVSNPAISPNNAAFVGTGALLSALAGGVDYPYTVAEIQAAVNAALAGDPDSVSPSIHDLAATFENEHECPLGLDPGVF